MSSRAALLLLPVIYLGYISLGLPDGTLGVAWPRMVGPLGADIGLLGTFALVGTLFSALSSFQCGRVIARFGTGPVVLLSGVLTGSGLLLIAHAQHMGWLWLASIPLGFGAGAVDAGLNSYVTRHYSGRHMNWLHACWGIGATCGPYLVTRAIAGTGGWSGGFLLLGTMQLSLAVVFLATLRLWSAVPTRRASQPCHDAPGAAPSLSAHSQAGWLSAVIFAVYVAVEATVGLWAGTILVLGRDLPQEAAGLCVTAYYASITVGRVLVGFVVDRWGGRRLVHLGLGVALAGAGCFAVADSVGLGAVSLVALGLGFAPIYPCLMHVVPNRFAADSVLTVIARQSGAAYLGAGLAPAAAGWLAEGVSLDGVAWAVVIVLVALTMLIRRVDRLTRGLACTPKPPKPRPVLVARKLAARTLGRAP